MNQKPNVLMIVFIGGAFICLAGMGWSHEPEPEMEAHQATASRSSTKTREHQVIAGPYHQLIVSGDHPLNGMFDPSVAYGSDGVGWLVYTAVDGPERPVGGYCHTQLAKSTDHGATWTFVQTINRATNDIIALPDGRRLVGHWSYEVASLVYDPTDQGKEWKLFAHRYFHNPGKSGDKRMPAYGWIIYQHASDPAGRWSREIPLFGAGVFPPAPFHVRINLNALHPDLAKAVAYTEPGVRCIGGKLYMNLTVVGPRGPEKVILLSSRDHGKTWSYISTLLDNADARTVGYEWFDAGALAQEKGRVFLLIAPGRGVFNHAGTFVIAFTHLAQGKLQRRQDGTLIVEKRVMRDDRLGGVPGAGESTYDAQNTIGGLIMPQFNTPAYPDMFQLYNTGVSLAE